MNDEMPTVGVLMSTYNGEKYIREQLDSIFNQERVKVKLFVRDDGSLDGTVDIVEEYSKNILSLYFWIERTCARVKVLCGWFISMRIRQGLTIMHLQIRMIFGFQINFA